MSPSANFHRCETLLSIHAHAFSFSCPLVTPSCISLISYRSQPYAMSCLIKLTFILHTISIDCSGPIHHRKDKFNHNALFNHDGCDYHWDWYAQCYPCWPTALDFLKLSFIVYVCAFIYVFIYIYIYMCVCVCSFPQQWYQSQFPSLKYAYAQTELTPVWRKTFVVVYHCFKFEIWRPMPKLSMFCIELNMVKLRISLCKSHLRFVSWMTRSQFVEVHNKNTNAPNYLLNSLAPGKL